MSHERRITLAQRQPNPLFVHWLQEWLRHAEQKDSMKRMALAKALDSLQRYPLVMQSGRDCCILDGFGSTICQMLDKQLAVHRTTMDTRQIISQSPCTIASDRNKSEQDILQLVREEVVKQNRKRNQEVANTKQPTVLDLFKKYGIDSEIKTNRPEEVKQIPVPQTKIIVEKNTFDIILLVDTQETAG